ncbi:unnamed protein product [Polarella glacialis]|uniref:Protein kinase domain-containing protein n=1 Tax=Polarella glacialis TaxID=89957 RepID=A0A813HDB2_POLGL|nr:unnamed protein product [Polarella glacialis]
MASTASAGCFDFDYEELSRKVKGFLRSPPVDWNSKKFFRYNTALYACFFLYSLDCVRVCLAEGPDIYVHSAMGLAFLALSLAMCLLGIGLAWCEDVRIKEIGSVVVVVLLSVGILMESSCHADVSRRHRTFFTMRAILNLWPVICQWRLWPSLIYGVLGIPIDTLMIAAQNMLHNEDTSFLLTTVFAIMFVGTYFQVSARTMGLYSTEQELRSEKEAFEGLLAMLCDAVACIGPDWDTILQSDCRMDSLTGQSMTGKLLSSCLAGDEERTRARDAFASAIARPALLPTTFTVDGESSKVDLFIVHRKGCFLLGIREVSERLARNATAGMAPIQLPGESVFVDDDQVSDISERPMSMTTEHILASGFNVTHLGAREHWLIEESDLSWDDSDVLGSGGFGVVAGAHFHGSLVAVKTVHSSSDSTSKASVDRQKSLLSELRMFRHLRHPHLVSFFGACIQVAPFQVSLVLERIEGGLTLSRFINGLSASCKDRRTCLLHVCSGIRYMHSLSPAILHKDIKPSNVLIQYFAVSGVFAKLSDFGLSHHLGKMTMSGSLHYMAPEVMCRGQQGTGVDVFSLGRLMYFVSTSCIPLTTTNNNTNMEVEASRIKARAMDGQIEVDWDKLLVLEDCRAIAEECMQLSPSARPCIAEVHIKLLCRWHNKLAISP